MTDYQALSAQLRDWRGDPDELMSEAADAIDKLSAQYQALRSALIAMVEEFRGYDLPYGSKAYQTANTALNNTKE